MINEIKKKFNNNNKFICNNAIPVLIHTHTQQCKREEIFLDRFQGPSGIFPPLEKTHIKHLARKHRHRVASVIFIDPERRFLHCVCWSECTRN